MFDPPGRIKDKLDELGAVYRFRLHSTTKVIREDNKPYGRIIDHEHGCRFFCDIIDLTTGQTYASGEGNDEPEALEAAVRAAEVAPKPMTKAQRSDPRLADSMSRLAEIEAENEALKARLAELEGVREDDEASEDEPADTPPDKNIRGSGRRRKVDSSA